MLVLLGAEVLLGHSFDQFYHLINDPHVSLSLHVVLIA